MSPFQHELPVRRRCRTKRLDPSKKAVITHTNPFEVLSEWGHQSPLEAVDIVVGGPPCPAFARVGRAKLREIQRHPEAFRHDPRAKLYVPYLHTLLNAANYGVPQMRERFFSIAIHEAARRKPSFPNPTHDVELPSGYKGSRQVALKSIQTDSLFSRYVPTSRPGPRLIPAVTAEQALRDLPLITKHLEGNDRRGARRFVTACTYRKDIEPSDYAQNMRQWPGFSSNGRILDHVTRCLSERRKSVGPTVDQSDSHRARVRTGRHRSGD
jgi:DNA (cytosine-5)-methyltransferase 1